MLKGSDNCSENWITIAENLSCCFDRNSDRRDTLQNDVQLILKANAAKKPFDFPKHTVLGKRDQSAVSHSDGEAKNVKLHMIYSDKKKLLFASIGHSRDFSKLEIPVTLKKVMISFFVEQSAQGYSNCDAIQKKLFKLLLQKKFGHDRFSQGQGTHSLTSPGPVQSLTQKFSSKRPFDIDCYFVKSFIEYEIEQIRNEITNGIELAHLDRLRIKIKYLETIFSEQCQTLHGRMQVYSAFLKLDANKTIHGMLFGSDQIDFYKGGHSQRNRIMLIKSQPVLLDRLQRFLDTKRNPQIMNWFKAKITKSIGNFIQMLYDQSQKKEHLSQQQYIDFFKAFLQRKRLPMHSYDIEHYSNLLRIRILNGKF